MNEKKNPLNGNFDNVGDEVNALSVNLVEKKHEIKCSSLIYFYENKFYLFCDKNSILESF